MGKRARRKAKNGDAPPVDHSPHEPIEASPEPVEEKQDERPFPAGDVNELRDLYSITDRMALLYHLYRWTLLTGELPEPEDWQRRDDWPHPNWVEDVYGNWDAMLDASGVDDARLLGMYEEQEKKLKEARRRADEATARARALAREESREPELRRQVDVAKRKREEVEDARAHAEAEASRARAELEAQRERAEDAERKLAEGLVAPAAEDPEIARLRAELAAARRDIRGGWGGPPGGVSRGRGAGGGVGGRPPRHRLHARRAGAPGRVAGGGARRTRPGSAGAAPGPGRARRARRRAARGRRCG